jgi:hypothetical protein
VYFNQCPFVVHPGRSFVENDGTEGAGITIPVFEVGSTTTEMLPSLYSSENIQIKVTIISEGNQKDYLARDLSLSY